MGRFAYILVFCAIIVAPALADDVTDLSTGDVGKKRVKRFKQLGKAMDSMWEKDFPAQNWAGIAQSAQAIADYAGVMPDYFPAGSDRDDDKARAKIWANFDDFTNHAKDLENTAQNLKDAAMRGDMGAVQTALGQLGDSCKACHRKYKYR